MSIRDDNDLHLEVSEEDEVVEMNASNHGNNVISTKGVGPCVAFIWSFNFDERPDSILDHYSFPDDESKSTVECTIILLLSRFVSLLEEFFTLNSFINKKKQYRITNVYLTATGGDYIEGSYYRQACVALYSNEICLNQFTNNEKILYIYIQLKHRVITLNPVTKSLSSQTAHKAQEKKIPIDFPSIWVIFSCVLKVASFEIRWRSPTRCFNIAYANIYLEPTQANQFQWQADTKKIEIFKTLAKPAEIKRLNKSIKLIPKDARTPHSATSPAVDLVAFREQDESHREQKQELKRKYDVTEETNNEDVACSSTDDSSKQQKLKYYNELKKVEDDDKKDEADYDSEDYVSEDENDDYDDANYDENYYDNNFDNDEPLDD
ncbi:unnamed protein product [Rotaria socialis]|uniref:Uncharacterized protein n=3 Tax=Rotaria socialis TaxID=392032 RepID=A0A817USV5_9BILA|nr:unnamed protein product [Rotaria socialis]CAF4907959.1 unnamed protein product [Rotaria socialis]